MQPLMNTWKTWSNLAALVIVMTRAMGASAWSWTFTILIAAALLSPPFVYRLVSWWLARGKNLGPQKGGDIVFTTGRGARGGQNGRVVIVGHSDPSSAAPMFTLSWRNVLDQAEASVDVYVSPGWVPQQAKDGSFLLALDEGRFYRRVEGEWKLPGSMPFRG